MPISPTTKLASQSMHPWQGISKPYTILLHYDPKWKRRTETETWALLFSATALGGRAPWNFVLGLLSFVSTQLLEISHPPCF